MRIRVRDNGMGIAAEVLPKIWDLFVQVNAASDRARGGLGIGLAVVRSLVHLHGGTVIAHSAGVDRGSEFCVYLPLLPEAVGDAPQAAAETARTESSPNRILVVDDNIDQAGSLAMLLGTMGHEIRVAYDGPGGIAIAAEFKPDVVFLDIGLPGMDGHEVARYLRGTLGLRQALVIALSGYGTEDDRKRSAESGFDAHLVKPADPARLAQLLAEFRP